MRLILRLAFSLSLLACCAAALADVQKGVESYRKGDYKRALDEFLAPARDGDVVALFYIAHMYENAQGLPENVPQAMTLYERAGDSGYAPAQNNLGVMYETSAAEKRSYTVAALWYRKAADQDYAPAQFNLGRMFYIGRGRAIPRDYEEAASWYRKAADLGYALAQNALGNMYENGQGVPVSLVHAYMWYSLASEGRNQVAMKNMQAVAAKMEPEAIAEAQAMLQEWRNSHKPSP